MQKKTHSQLIKNTEELKIKSRRRLFGSIFVLLIILVILLKLTSKSSGIEEPVTVNIVKEVGNSKKIESINQATIESKAQLANNLSYKNESDTTVKLPEVDAISTQAKNNTSNENKSFHLNPKIVFEWVQDDNPDNILNNIESHKKTFFVQFEALANHDKILLEQTKLNQLGINTRISKTTINNKIFYRLRSKGFENRAKAEQYLDGIISKIDSK